MANANPPRAKQIPVLPEFSATEDWVTLSDKIIKNANLNHNETQFLTIYKVLPEAIRHDFSALLKSNANTTYAELITSLQERFSLPAHKKFDCLYSIEELGDRNPKYFLRHLRNKYAQAGGITDENLKYAYSRGLPQHYRMIVFSTDPANLDDAANKLEDVWYSEKSANMRPNNPFTAAQTMGISSNHMFSCNMNAATPSASQWMPGAQSSFFERQMDTVFTENVKLKAEIQRTQDQLDRLEKELARLRNQSLNNNNRKVQSNNGPRYVAPPKSDNIFVCPKVPSENDRQGLCMAHLRFGGSAYTCQMQGCSFNNLKAQKHSCSSYCPWSQFLDHGLPGRNKQKNY